MTKPIATNRKAFRDYEIIESMEAGIELKGGEVKSVRAGSIHLEDSFARVEKGQVSVYNINILPYAQASYLNADPVRSRRLLLHKKEIIRLGQALSQKGLTLVPLKIYFNSRGIAKLEIALCKGKKLYDKRADIKDKEINRQMRRVMKSRNR
ncbi:MAG: SsrA-binding protein SmpB [Candidatus Omnitrophica bacterium]|jgi:SsrA-binding protein|nr:SsrA-binding protein SmpB [Candidatus Omnitrophota bacterium]